MNLYGASCFLSDRKREEGGMKLPIEVARDYLRECNGYEITERGERVLAKTIFDYALAVLKYCEPCERNGEPAIRMKSQYLLLPESLRSEFPKESLEFFRP